MTETQTSEREERRGYECSQPGCERSTASGDAIHRTSPKGGPFRGMCEEHHPNPDPEILAITDLCDGKGLGE